MDSNGTISEMKSLYKYSLLTVCGWFLSYFFPYNTPFISHDVLLQTHLLLSVFLYWATELKKEHICIFKG